MKPPSLGLAVSVLALAAACSAPKPPETIRQYR